MAEKVIEAMRIVPDGVYVDCTAGGGGHSELILGKLGAKGQLIAIDRDRDACLTTKMKLENTISEGNWEVIQSKFSSLKQILAEREIDSIQGVLADLGVSSMQLDRSERGFSYHQDGPLDMRMDVDHDLSAANWLSRISERELGRILREYGEERYARRIARAIIKARDSQGINTTAELATIIVKSMPAASRREAQHPARRSFQAIRIAVNNELGELEQLLDILPSVIADQGRIVIITFHSLEDRLVKQRFKQWEDPCVCPPDFPLCICNKKSKGRIINSIEATANEIESNIRARSARMRVFERRVCE